MVYNDTDTEYMLDLFDKAATIDVVPESRFFVACFSRHADDLSQWRAYGGGENGYAVALHTRSLISVHSIIAKVNYSRGLYEQLAAETAAALVEFFRKVVRDGRAETRETWAAEFPQAWDAYMGQIGPMVKDPTFAAEGEFRCIHELAAGEASRVEFRQKRTLLAWYLPLFFPPPGRPRSSLLSIMEVMVGPCRHSAVAKASIEMLLR